MNTNHVLLRLRLFKTSWMLFFVKKVLHFSQFNSSNSLVYLSFVMLVCLALASLSLSGPIYLRAHIGLFRLECATLCSFNQSVNKESMNKVYKTNIDCSIIGWWWKLSLPRCFPYQAYYQPLGFRLGVDSRPGMESTSGVIISTIILLSSQYLYTISLTLEGAVTAAKFETR